MNLDFSPQEVQTLLNLLDLATKAGGLQAAQAALPLAIKLQTALDQQPKE